MNSLKISRHCVWQPSASLPPGLAKRVRSLQRRRMYVVLVNLHAVGQIWNQPANTWFPSSRLEPLLSDGISQSEPLSLTR